MGLFSKKFNKKASNDNATEPKKGILDDEAIPAVGAGAATGALAAGGGIAGVMLLVGAATAPIGVGLPIIAGGALVGAVTGKLFHSGKKRKQKKQGPKGPSA